jgi:LPS-assembly lipoprotein
MVTRIALLCLSLTALSGCGLHPLYGGPQGAEVQSMLSDVAVAPIAGQSGWLVRAKLADRLGSSEVSKPRYRLVVTLDDNITSFGIRGDRAATFERRSLRARYQLVAAATGLVLLDATAGSDAGIDIVSSEYATVAAEQTTLERLADQVADQIVIRVAIYASHSGPAQ